MIYAKSYNRITTRSSFSILPTISGSATTITYTVPSGVVAIVTFFGRAISFLTIRVNGVVLFEGSQPGMERTNPAASENTVKIAEDFILSSGNTIQLWYTGGSLSNYFVANVEVLF